MGNLTNLNNLKTYIMKTLAKLLALILISTLSFACSVEDTSEDNGQDIEIATGGEGSSELDNDRDPDGD